MPALCKSQNHLLAELVPKSIRNTFHPTMVFSATSRAPRPASTSTISSSTSFTTSCGSCRPTSSPSSDTVPSSSTMSPKGKSLVQGQLAINFISPGYLIGALMGKTAGAQVHHKSLGKSQQPGFSLSTAAATIRRKSPSLALFPLQAADSAATYGNLLLVQWSEVIGQCWATGDWADRGGLLSGNW
jgi:hypothetical protein